MTRHGQVGYLHLKLIMTLLVRDEADIIRTNIEFHLAQGVDFIVAVDNNSLDGTRDILDDYARAGVAQVFDEPGRDYAQSNWVTRAALHAREALSADWILNNDADEFWTAPGTTLKDVVRGAGHSLLRCPRLNMFCACDDPETGGWPERLIYRVSQPVPEIRLADFYNDPLPCPYLYLDLPSKALVRAAGLTRVAQGNHGAEFDGTIDEASAAVEIFHFPIRSRRQLEKKVIQGGQAYAANTELPERAGWHWRRWYSIYQKQGIDAVFADACPSRQRLDSDLAAGGVIKDTRFRARTTPVFDSSS